MRDEHLIYCDLPRNKILIRPESGYSIYCILSQHTVSEVITEERGTKYFKAVEGGVEAVLGRYGDELKGGAA